MNYCSFDGIEFHILAPMTDWRIESVRVKELVPYSNITVSERIGHSPATASWDLLFYCMDDWEAFVSRFGEGSPGVLRIPVGLQTLKGTQETRNNPPCVYDVLDNVSIDAIDTARRHIGGKVKVLVTFERMVDPVTRLAVVP